ncbi:ATP phosphoribosyltransferase regulatory subunit [Pseudalkalibacillus hwajinpoensis]|uniref:ATP phosphoribosyltransferase regulatory subunit n=1 Tax=Guptibacillus hwajinpoensis TaxID=208199 RepID=UPI00384D8C0A
MTRPFVFEKPLGMRDTLPVLYDLKTSIREKIQRVTEGWGYRFMNTPTLEYYETVGEASAILDQQLFKLLDQRGNTLVLRPDMTAPIARVAASSLKNEPFPLRLAYDSNVFRAQEDEGGKPAEFEQIGVELIGDRTTSADGEVIALMAAVLKEAGLEDFQIAIGHVGFIQELFLSIVGNEERAAVLRRYLYEKNYVGYRQHVREMPLSTIDQKRLMALLTLRGDGSKLEEAIELLPTDAGERVLDELRTLLHTLEAYGVANQVKFDFTLVSHMSYYTGVVFEGYANNLGVPLSNGGRYDELLSHFDRPAQATGFGIRLDHLAEALGVTSEEKLPYAIIFSPERREEAIQQASERRANGEKVVVQELSGVTNLDAYSERFDDVTYLIGKNGKGML